MPIIPVLRKLEKEDCEFEASLVYIANPVEKGEGRSCIDLYYHQQSQCIS
jgi:hypothetical protein